MKRIMLILMLAGLMLAVSCTDLNAQVPQGRFAGVGGVGAAFENCGTLSAFAGFEYALRIDSVTKARTYGRVVGQFTDRYNKQEDEGVGLWLMTDRRFWGGIYLGVGGGYAVQVKEGQNEQAAGLKLEISWAPIDMAALIAGIDHYPDAGEYSKNVNFIYFGINLR